jgi:hypothetical protein
MDTSRVKIRVFEETDQTIGEIQAISVKDQAQRLKEKYKEYRKNGDK